MKPPKLTTRQARRIPRPTGALAAALLVAVVGCNEARFEQDSIGLIDAGVAPGHAEQIETILTELFGTPDEPKLPDESPLLAELIDIEKLRQAAGPVASHEAGVTTGLYRRHCARCHGVTGDGRGPTALYQNPYPRDFRRGVFKFTSTPRGVPPTDDDLHAALQRGSPGTAMPSFKLLKEDELAALVDYVKYLAIRGQVEQELIHFAGDELDYNPVTGEEGKGLSLEEPADREFVVEVVLGEIVDRWYQARFQVIEPSPPPEGFPDGLVDLGRELFADEQRLGCAKCHAGGENAEQLAGPLPSDDYDLWNKRRHEFSQRASALANEVSRLLNGAKEEGFANQQYNAMLREMTARQEAAALMLPTMPARPRRLRGQALRGGSEPADLFRRIQQGVDGSPMPSLAGVLSNEEVWALVAYVLHENQAEAEP